jgi:hypoxanthine phosphoribosyltransferase
MSGFMSPRYGKLASLLDKQYLLITWADIAKMVVDLGNKILSQPPRPNLIISIARGGVTVGNLVTDHIFGKSTSKRNYEIIPIRCRTWCNIENGRPPTDEDFEVLQGLPQGYRDLSDYDVLGIDDVLDTGITWYQLKRRIIDPARPRSFRVASLHMKDWSKFEPDFYLEKVPHKWWIFYAWEPVEVTESTLKMLLDRGYEFSDAAKMLRETFDYIYREFDKTTVEKIFEQARHHILNET